MTPAGDMDQAQRRERIRQLQQRLYSADSAESLTDAAREAAIEELRTLSHPATTTLPEARTDGAAAAVPSPAVDVANDDTSSTGYAARDAHRRGIALTIIGIAAALIVGVAIGASTSGAISRALSAPATPPPTAAAAVFARPQAPVDVPDIPLGDRFVADSFRQLLEAGLDTLYLARNVDGEICLVVVIQTRDFAATCTPESDLDASGLQLRWRSVAPYRDLPDQPSASDFSFTWHPDGSTEMGASN